jgi:beta-galactosidase
VLTNFDMVATTGGQDIAVVESFLASADSTGTITLQFTPGAADQPQINGIEIGLGGAPAPAAPAGLTAKAVGCSDVLHWTASTTTDAQYEVFRSTTPGFTPSPNNLITTTSAVLYVDGGLTPSTTYYYVVEANNTLQTSQPSNQAIATTAAFCFPQW